MQDFPASFWLGKSVKKRTFKAMSRGKEISREAWLVLQRIQEVILLTPDGQDIRYEIDPKPSVVGYPSPVDQVGIIASFERTGAIKIIRHNSISKPYDALYEEMRALDGSGVVKGFFFKKISPRFESVYRTHADVYEKVPINQNDAYYTISIKDREIWINDFILSRPYSGGKNMLVLEAALENSNKTMTRNDLPGILRKEMEGEEFTKILNALGFKGEILKSFFPIRAKSRLLFRDKVSKDQLQAEGRDLKVLESELEKAHEKNTKKKNPK